MSMTTNVIGIRPPDEKWKKMKEVWDACERADVGAPKEVGDFFRWERPDDAGVVVDLSADCCQKFRRDSCEGFVVDITKLPKDVTLIKFTNSY